LAAAAEQRLKQYKQLRDRLGALDDAQLTSWVMRSSAAASCRSTIIERRMRRWASRAVD